MSGVTKYKASFLVGVTQSMEYRFDFFLNLLSTVFPIIMQIFLWIAMYSGSGMDAMYGYTFPQMIMYVVVAGAVSKFTSTGIEYTVNEDIHSGGLAKFITKPVNYILFRLTGAIGLKSSAMFTMFVLTVVSVFVLYFVVGLPIQLAAILLFIPSLLLATILNFYIFFCISTLAFWLTEIGNFFHAISVVIMVLSGGVFPVSIFGPEFEMIAKYIPLTYTINYPIQILAGKVLPGAALKVIGIQLVWIITLMLLAKLMWRRGLKKYVAVGG